MELQGPESWYAGLPRITRAYITLVLGITLLSTLHMINPSALFLDWNFIRKFELWRIVLNCFYIGPFSIRWILFVSLFTQFSSILENNPVFANSVGSYLYFIIVQMFMLSVISLAFFWPTGYPMLGDSLLFAIIYYWSRRDMWSNVSIYFFTVKAYQLPFAMLFLHLVIGSSLWIDIMGLVSGHSYYLIREILPSKGFPNILLKTPRFIDFTAEKLEKLLSFSVPSTVGSTSTYYYRPSSQGQASSSFIGRGTRLGSS